MTNRHFDSGASRDTIDGKSNFEGFFSPLVLKSFARYMHRKKTMSDGHVRQGDDWQQGMPLEVYMDSMLRHIIDLWLHHRGYGEYADENIEDCLAGIQFNSHGYWFETLIGRKVKKKSTGDAGVPTTIVSSEPKKEVSVYNAWLDVLRRS